MALIKKEDGDKTGKKNAAGQGAVKKESPVKKDLALKKESPVRKVAPKAERKISIGKGFLVRLGNIRSFFRAVFGELKKVHWPTRREVLVYTVVVVVAVVIVAALIWVFDSLMSRVLQSII